ncbi:MAG: hypothetical protein WDM76_05445 [Limisphaerales bacterium]
MLGADHPDMLQTRRDLAVALVKESKYAEAAEVQQKSWLSRKA